MTDYTKATGTTGTMMIRDTGTNIEFWLTSGNNSSYNHALPWGFVGNGQTQSNLTYDYVANSGWQRFGFFPVTTSQTITFKIYDSGTGGIGGPTTLSVAISRQAAPSAPSVPKFANVTSTSVDVSFTDGANNGAAIDSRQISYGLSSSGGTTTISSDGSTTVTGLTPGSTYYFWARTHNVKGYSPWAGPSSVVMLNVPSAPAQPLLSSVTATTIDVSFTPATSAGGSPITGYEIGYGEDLYIYTAPTVVPASSPQTITGLKPGTLYHIWVRAKNAIGNGPWSVVNSATTVAGVYINVGGTWKLAVAYVNVGGTWTAAEVWSRSVGVWNRTL